MNRKKNDQKEEAVRIAAYYISQKNYNYDELCWMLAEKQIAEQGIITAETTEDALKFFQAYITEMMELGGVNLPKTVSTRLGAKLATYYKKLGISDVNNALKKSYEVLKGKTNIKRLNDNTIEVKTTYKRNFCPIGGGYKSDKAEIVQKSICSPFTIGFLNSLDPHYKYEGEVIECILSSNGCLCHYLLHIQEKNK
ncbi:MAG: hypothetical protein ACTSQJ_18945 [Promethearchaeota archaeon]